MEKALEEISKIKVKVPPEIATAARYCKTRDR